MVIGNSLFCRCGRVVEAIIIWRIHPRIGKCFDALKEYHRSITYSEDRVGIPYDDLI
jgi:hypothetical protein